jgi:hypothetical protein
MSGRWAHRPARRSKTSNVVIGREVIVAGGICAIGLKSSRHDEGRSSWRRTRSESF